MKKPEEKMAVIKNVYCGVGESGKFSLWFDTYTSEWEAALQVFEGGVQVGKIVESFGVRDVKNLNGKTCWVESGRGLIKFLRPFKS